MLERPKLGRSIIEHLFYTGHHVNQGSDLFGSPPRNISTKAVAAARFVRVAQ
jgi:hypothetical protein